MKRLSTIKHLVNYCQEQKKPILITGIRLMKQRRKTGNSYNYLMNVNYLFNEKKETYMMHNDYINAALQVNNVAARQFMNHKENLLKRCPDLVKREFLIMNESSREQVLDFIYRHPKLVAKVNESAGSRGVYIYDSEGIDPNKVFEQINARGAGILEEYIYQHEAINEIYPKSVNTIRIHTANNGKEVRCFMHPKMRLGANGSAVDVASESYRLVLNPDGTVKEAIYMSFGLVEKAEYHKETGKRFSEVRIPFMEEVYELVKEAAVRCPETPYIGWDVAIREDGPVLIEGNGCSGCMNIYQQITHLYHGRGMKEEIIEMLKFVMGENDAKCLCEAK